MLKKVCDRCGQDNGIESYSLPIFKKIEAKGGLRNATLLSWSALRKEDLDLCEACKLELANMINFFMEYKTVESEQWN